jgi:hypothetical protein
MVIAEMGIDFWTIIAKSVQLKGSLGWGASVEDFVREACRIFRVLPHHVTFSSILVRELGHGFCYLDCILPSYRLCAYLTLGVFPYLEGLFCHFERWMVDDFYILVCFDDSHEGCYTYGAVFSGYPNYQVSSDAGTDYEIMMWDARCSGCLAGGVVNHWSRRPFISHKTSCDRNSNITCTPLNDEYLWLKLGGFSDLVRFKGSSKHAPSSSKASNRKRLSDSREHNDTQVLGFQKSIKGDGIEPDMTRDLFSVPKPDKVETMADHISRHVDGDMFPYLAVVGNEEESKDSRLARLRAFRSPYGKENKPEMRINGVILDEIEGTILVQHLKDHVDSERLTREQSRQNKRSRPLKESSFKKPYLLVARITGEYVPLMSSTADYTDLYFTLEDGRLLDHQTIVQSNKIPSNQNGVFELSCDYCINVKDLSQLSLKYFLARPIMKDGFQWGSISLTIRISEADTPFLNPKIEAMAVIRAPYTTLEEHSKDPDHADVVFTSAQIPQFREMYRSGDIVDVDEPKKIRTRKSSYSKSTIRGEVKGELGPSHLAEQSGWEHLSGMRKPLLPEDQASIDAESRDEDDIDVKPTTKADYERQQELLRAQFQGMNSDSTEDVSDRDLSRSPEPKGKEIEIHNPKSAMKKTIRFSPPEVQDKPNTRDVYQFDD